MTGGKVFAGHTPADTSKFMYPPGVNPGDVDPGFAKAKGRHAPWIETPHKVHKAGGARLWKGLTAFIMLPIMAATYHHAFISDRPKRPERPEFRPWMHLRRHTKNYPWGDGKTTLFHNPHTNATAEGYADSH